MNLAANISPAPVGGDPRAIASAAIARNDLRRALVLLSRTIGRRATIPVLECAHVSIGDGAVRLAGTDLDMEVAVEVEAATSGDAEMMINARTLAAFVETTLVSADALLRIEVVKGAGGRRIVLSDGEITIQLNNHMPVEDYPDMISRAASTPATGSVEATPAEWRRLLRLTRPCVSSDMHRYYLCGVHVSRRGGGTTLRALAATGSFGAVIESAVEAPDWPEDGVIIPTRAVDLMLAIIGKGNGNEPIRMEVRDRLVTMSTGGITVATKLVDSTFPDLDRLIPSRTGAMAVHLGLASLRRLYTLGRATAGSSVVPVTFDLKERIAKILSPGLGCTIMQPIQASSTGSGEQAFTLSASFMFEIAKVAGALKITGDNPREAFRVEGEDPDAVWVIMPMRV